MYEKKSKMVNVHNVQIEPETLMDNFHMPYPLRYKRELVGDRIA